MTHKLNSDQTVAIDPALKWKKVGPDTPRGKKLLLISKAAGVTQQGLWSPSDKFFTHYHELPTFDKNEDAL